jgi:hypothetical protein
MTESIDDLMATFATAARAHYQASEAGDYKVANPEAERIEAVFSKVRTIGPSAREALMRLAELSDDATAVMAAVYSLKYSPERSLRVLGRFSKNRGLLGFQASQAIKRWNAGEWQLE